MSPLNKRFAHIMQSLGIGAGKPLIIACSGGGDSMALCLLAQEWAKARNVPLMAVTVDHGLRPGSAKEAKQVGAWLEKRAVAHTTLAWKGRKPTANIQEAARKARYRLLSDYGRAHGVAQVLVAHTLEDQAETFLLRLARGSGVDGLACMAPVATVFGMTLLRPLLTVPKAELLRYLKECKQDYIRDPSNENPAFDRVKVRTLMPQLAGIGLDAQRLARTAQIMARARAHLEEETGRLLAAGCRILPEGYAVTGRMQASEEIGLRALSTLIMLIGGQEVKTRLQDLERLYHALKAPGFRGATLGGCLFAPLKRQEAGGEGSRQKASGVRGEERILICREPSAVAKPMAVKAGETIVWDNRFEVKCLTPHAACRVGALGQSGWLALARAHCLHHPCPDKRILYTLPALRDARGKMMAVPHLGWKSDNSSQWEATFRNSLR